MKSIPTSTHPFAGQTVLALTNEPALSVAVVVQDYVAFVNTNLLDEDFSELFTSFIERLSRGSSPLRTMLAVAKELPCILVRPAHGGPAFLVHEEELVSMESVLETDLRTVVNKTRETSDSVRRFSNVSVRNINELRALLAPDAANSATARGLCDELFGVFITTEVGRHGHELEIATRQMLECFPEDASTAAPVDLDKLQRLVGMAHKANHCSGRIYTALMTIEMRATEECIPFLGWDRSAEYLAMAGFSDDQVKTSKVTNSVAQQLGTVVLMREQIVSIISVLERKLTVAKAKAAFVTAQLAKAKTAE